MASGVNVKMGVTGVAKFKQDINTAKQQIKTMDAQLALSEKQFKQTGDAESYMQEKTELLRAKMEEQKIVLQTAENALQSMKDNGVTAASKAFQEMQRQVLAAKGDLIDTENQLSGVANSANDAEDNVDGMNRELKRIGDGVNIQNVTGALDKITGGLEKAARKALNFAKQIAGAMIDAGSWADDLHTRAMNYGVSDEQLQRMEKTSRIIDTSVESIVSSQKKLRMGLGKEDKEVMGGLVELLGEGYDPRGKDWETVFWDAGEALMKFTDAEEKEVYAQKLFGRSWQELIPLFSAGREEYEKTNESWSVVAQENIDKLTAMDDEYQKIMANWETFKYEALSQFAEPMQKAMETINQKLGEFTAWLSSDEGQAFIGSVVDKMKEALEWICEPENIQSVIDAVKTIIAGWAGLKLVGGGLQMFQLISGAKGLLGGASGGAGAAASGAGAAGVGGAGSAAGVGASFMKAGSAVIPWLAPAAVVGAAVAPAMLAQAADERKWAQEKADRLAAAEKLSGGDAAFMRKSADVMDQIHHWTDDPFKLLMGLQDRGAEQKALLFSMLAGKGTSYGNYATNELLDLWKTGGEGWDQARLDALLTTVSESYERMAEQTGEVTGATEDQSAATKDLTEAAKEMQKLPGEVAKKLNGITVNMDGQTVGRIVLPYVNSGLANLV